MNRSRRFDRAWVVVLAIAAGARAAAREPIRTPLVLELGWARGAGGTAELRDDLARSAWNALEQRGCFGEVLIGSEPAEPILHIDVVLDDLREEIRYDDSLAEHADPSRPGQGLRVTALSSVFVRWTMSAGGAAAPLAAKSFRIERQRRPLTVGEDPAARARSEMIEAVGRELARSVCAVSRKKMAAAFRDPPR